MRFHTTILLSTCAITSVLAETLPFAAPTQAAARHESLAPRQLGSLLGDLTSAVAGEAKSIYGDATSVYGGVTSAGASVISAISERTNASSSGSSISATTASNTASTGASREAAAVNGYLGLTASVGTIGLVCGAFAVLA